MSIPRALGRLGRSGAFRTSLVFVAAITIAAGTYVAIAAVRARADDSRQTVAAFSDLKALLDHNRTLEVVAEQQISSEVTSAIDRARTQIKHSIAELVRLEREADHVKRFVALHRDYDVALAQELQLLEAGDIARARRVDTELVDPRYRVLADVVDEERVEHRERAALHDRQAQRGTAGMLLLAALLVAMLFWKRQQGQLVLERLTRRNQSILDAAGEGIYGLDREGRTVFANPAAARMTGHDVAELLGRRSHDVVHHSRPDGSPFPVEECDAWLAVRDGTFHRCDHDVYWRKDGTSFPVEYTVTPIVENGAVNGAVVVFTDITERRAMEHAKDEFTAVVSHELRTPLTSIRGSLGLLESGVLGELPEKGRRMVQIAVQNTDRLVRLINDILDLERINAGTIDLHPALCDARELIKRAAESLGQLAADAGVELAIDAEPVALTADPDRVLQTLTNLISNAVKFSPAGSTVHLSSARQDGEVRFEVSDSGRGIPADKLDSIFERFQQVDASDARQKGGTGLGLAICRTIVEHHHGRIWATSELGRGSTFSFVLPAHHINTAVAPEHAHEGPVILVCDDDPSVVEVVAAMLEQRGYRVIATHSGEQALERALAERPDAMLLDLLMPGMSGWQVAQELQRHPETRTMPIVILSVLSQDEAEAPSAVAADWIEKPLDEQTLFGALERALAGQRTIARVLIVEDDLDLATVLIALFERHGVRALHAASGAEAIELSRDLLPNLLILDVGLPEGDGFWVAEWLRQHERLSSIPIVVYTGRDLDAADRQRLDTGHTHFMTKGAVTLEQFERDVLKLVAAIAPAATAADDPHRSAR